MAFAIVAINSDIAFAFGYTARNFAPNAQVPFFSFHSSRGIDADHNTRDSSHKNCKLHSSNMPNHG